VRGDSNRAGTPGEYDERPGGGRVPISARYGSGTANLFRRRRATVLDLFASVDFSEINIVPWQDRVDVRNKRLHVTDYLKPGGEAGDGWFVETPEFKVDASSTIGMTLSDTSFLSQFCYGRSLDRESRQETVRGGTNEQCRY
jgi:hypothetical protein